MFHSALLLPISWDTGKSPTLGVRLDSNLPYRRALPETVHRLSYPTMIRTQMYIGATRYYVIIRAGLMVL